MKIKKGVIDNTHPYLINKSLVASQGVLVLDGVNRMPVYGTPCISEDMIMVFCQRGISYDTDINLSANGVSILLPDQIVCAHSSSEDYLVTLVIVSRQFYDSLSVYYPYARHSTHYRHCPVAQFTDEQFGNLMHAVNVLRAITQIKSDRQHQLLFSQVSVLLAMVANYRKVNNPDEVTLSPRTRLFSQFYDSIVENYQKSHEVNFYAELQGLSPKHFSSLIKAETGTNASEWINKYIIIRAKMMLMSQSGMNVQQISYNLGFSEQSSFTRFFKSQTGITPKEYREKHG